MKIHMVDLRLRNNGGLDYPVCYIGLKRGLDLDKSKLSMTNKPEEVTCERCKRLYGKIYPKYVSEGGVSNEVSTIGSSRIYWSIWMQPQV
jgi:hypothetical protein